MNYNKFDLNLLKYFLNVAEYKSVSLASKKMFISQPSVSKAIKRLEKQLGGTLFIRKPRGVILTKEGEVFHSYCKRTIQTLENGIEEFSSLNALEKGVIKIGSSSTIIRHILVPFFQEFSKKYSNIDISITDGNSQALIDLLKSSKVDLIIDYSYVENEFVSYKKSIGKIQDCFIAHPDFKKDIIKKEDFNKYNFILQKKPSTNRDYFDKLCLDNNIVISPKYEFTSFGLIRDFTLKNLGIGFSIKEFITPYLKEKKLKILKTDFNIEKRNINIMSNKDSLSRNLVKIFIKSIENYFK